VPRSTQLALSTEELREVHLALAVRITQLAATDTSRMGPNQTAKLKRRIDVCTELNELVQKARGRED
jgi:hypothetical protein